jgi:N-formylglutamate deformylase
MILHIPHSSRLIPADVRDQIVLSDEELCTELTLMTDAFVDELFASPATTVVRFPMSRLVLDVERFPEDAQEPMSKVGMGMIYTRTASGKTLRRPLHLEEKTRLLSLYEAHHQALTSEVEKELARTGSALILDCHSFPDQPLPCDLDQSTPRPQFCIGTDSFHTPKALARSTAASLKTMGHSVRMNRPYAGTLVPSAFWKNDRRVASIMVEVNRSLYMDQMTGGKTGAFDSLKAQLQSLLLSVKESQQQAQRDSVDHSVIQR